MKFCRRTIDLKEKVKRKQHIILHISIGWCLNLKQKSFVQIYVCDSPIYVSGIYNVEYYTLFKTFISEKTGTLELMCGTNELE